MPRNSGVTVHPKRALVERDLLDGIPYHVIAKRYPPLSEPQIKRYKARMRKAAEWTLDSRSGAGPRRGGGLSTLAAERIERRVRNAKDLVANTLDDWDGLRARVAGADKVDREDLKKFDALSNNAATMLGVMDLYAKLTGEAVGAQPDDPTAPRQQIVVNVASMVGIPHSTAEERREHRAELGLPDPELPETLVQSAAAQIPDIPASTPVPRRAYSSAEPPKLREARLRKAAALRGEQWAIDEMRERERMKAGPPGALGRTVPKR